MQLVGLQRAVSRFAGASSKAVGSQQLVFSKPVRLVGLSKSVQLVGLSVRLVGWRLWLLELLKLGTPCWLNTPNRARKACSVRLVGLQRAISRLQAQAARQLAASS